MADDIHTCSYECQRPACIKAQRDELREGMKAALARIEELEQANREASERVLRLIARLTHGEGRDALD